MLYASVFGAQILRRWDLRSGSELQLGLERKTYLISTLLAFVFSVELLSLFLFVFTADALRTFFVGAMCAAGTLHVNGFGYPALLLKIVNFVLAGTWLVLNAADIRGYDYPADEKKVRLPARLDAAHPGRDGPPDGVLPEDEAGHHDLLLRQPVQLLGQLGGCRPRLPARPHHESRSWA